MWCVLLLGFVALSSAAGLRDAAFVGSAMKYLDGDWVLSNGNTSVKATVPGDIITDLQNAKLVGDPMFATNWLDQKDMWASTQWTYTKQFVLGAEFASAGEIYLNFDGIKMGATVTLNGGSLAPLNDQFVRFSFPVKNFLKFNGATNDIVITFAANFGSDVDVSGRFMACTGGWDWSPYSNTFDAHGAHTLSFGIWKSVYFTAISPVGIDQMRVHQFWNGNYPTKPLTEKDPVSFTVNVTVTLMTKSPMGGKLVVNGSWGVSVAKDVALATGLNPIVVSLPATNVALWWPNGHGKQPLYDVTASFTQFDGKQLNDSRKVGFRVVALVTADDSDPSKLKGKDGSGSLTMRFRINGANIWIRGGNMIPMENFEGRANAEAFTRLVQSAAEGNFNMLRIWGGGIFFYDAFYDECDRLGILLYHDMMYAQQGHSPLANQLQAYEIRYNVIRLSHHPSIIVWDACNECGGQGIYNNFVVSTIIEVDKSRPVWPSCPACGYESGVDMLWGLPNGKKLVPRPPCNTLETHGPYQHGTGFKTVDDPQGKLVLFPSNLPPTLKVATPTGPSIRGVFASEFGCVGMSSFESMSVTLPEKDWSLHSAPMAERNYPCDNIIEVYWGKQDFSQTGEAAFKKQLYQCLIGQALEMKGDIEVRRSTNEWGTVIWQLNEIWPTGGWGSIEYGTPLPGQVIGGRWKPLHHWISSILFRSLFASCSADNEPKCFVKNDSTEPVTGDLHVAMVRFSDGQIIKLQKTPFNLAAGAGVTAWSCAVDSPARDGTCLSWADIIKEANCVSPVDCMIITEIHAHSEIITNFVPLTAPYEMKLPKPEITWHINEDNDIFLKTDNTALFVTLTTQAQGRFSENAFLMTPGTKKIQFLWFGKVDIETLRSTLRIEHAQMYF